MLLLFVVSGTYLAQRDFVYVFVMLKGSCLVYSRAQSICVFAKEPGLKASCPHPSHQIHVSWQTGRLQILKWVKRIYPLNSASPPCTIPEEARQCGGKSLILPRFINSVPFLAAMFHPDQKAKRSHYLKTRGQIVINYLTYSPVVMTECGFKVSPQPHSNSVRTPLQYIPPCWSWIVKSLLLVYDISPSPRAVIHTGASP